MKKYRTFVINGRRFISRLVAAVVISAIVVTSFICIKNYAVIPDAVGFSQIIINTALPQVGASHPQTPKDTPAQEKKIGTDIKDSLEGLNPFSSVRLMESYIPLMPVVNRGYLGRLAKGDVYKSDAAKKPGTDADTAATYPITEVNSGVPSSGTTAKILIRNETNYSVDINSMLSSPLSFDMKSNGPKVLIVHTHASESYAPQGASEYKAGSSDRSLDSSRNMIAVGEAARAVLEREGIEVIHDKTLHDQPNFNGSYANSLKTVEGYLAKYPSICVVLDLHRDAFVYENGSKAKFVTEINGQKTAQLMLVVGTDAGGLDHPSWRENMKFALKIQSRILERYPGLMRSVNLRRERFNGHTTKGSLIIEVGSSGNSLDEAVRGISLAAEEIAGLLSN